MSARQANRIMMTLVFALLIGIIYGLLVSGGGKSGRIQRLTKAVFDGVTGS